MFLVCRTLTLPEAQSLNLGHSVVLHCLQPSAWFVRTSWRSTVASESKDTPPGNRASFCVKPEDDDMLCARLCKVIAPGRRSGAYAILSGSPSDICFVHLLLCISCVSGRQSRFPEICTLWRDHRDLHARFEPSLVPGKAQPEPICTATLSFIPSLPSSLRLLRGSMLSIARLLRASAPAAELPEA